MEQSYNHTKMKDLEEHDGLPQRPSKSQRKRDMHALQRMGEELAGLPQERLARIDLPEGLREALLQVRQLSGREARRRQMQYIGRLMRNVDPAPIREALDVLHGACAIETARQRRLERLRERLLADETVLGEIGAAHPGVDLAHLKRLRRGALHEREAGRPPKNYRELFRALREIENA
jgi:ribosome-associated protein